MTHNEQVLSVLRGAYALIEKPERWCKGAAARDSGNYKQLEGGYKACSWSLYGAVGRAARDIRADPGIHGLAHAKVLDVVSTRGEQRVWNVTLSSFNDDPATTHADVLAVLREAIKRAEGVR